MLSVGTILSKERKRRGLTLKDVEKQIRVREKFLEAIENNNWTAFSSKIYITGIIKTYSKFFELDPEKMIAYFRRDYERKEDVHFKRRVESKYFKSETRRVLFIGLLIIFLAFASYFGYQLSVYFAPPKIAVISPVTTVVNSTDRIKIVGKTEPDATVMIFEERVYQDKDGRFEYDFPVKKGKNVLKIDVTGANGKSSQLIKEFRLE